MKTTRQRTAYYGNNRYGHPTAMLCTEWHDRANGQARRIIERAISCDTIDQARALAYGMSSNVKPLIN